MLSAEQFMALRGDPISPRESADAERRFAAHGAISGELVFLLSVVAIVGVVCGCV